MLKHSAWVLVVLAAVIPYTVHAQTTETPAGCCVEVQLISGVRTATNTPCTKSGGFSVSYADCVTEFTNDCQWVATYAYDPETGQCKQAPVTQAPVTPEDLDTSPPVKSPITFIPQIQIPGLFGGEEIQVGSQAIGQYIAAFYMFFVSLVAILAVAMLVLGGYRRIAAAGNVSRIRESDEIMNAALAGILLTFLSYLLLNLINPTLTRLSGFQLPEVQNIPYSYESTEAPQVGSGLGDVEVNVSTGQIIRVTGVSDTYDAEILEAAINHNIPEYAALLKAIMQVESGGKPWVVSPAGACGLMQVLPSNVNQSDCTGMITRPVEPTDSDIVKEQKEAIIKRNLDNGARLFADYLKNTCPTSANLKSGKTVTCDPSKTKCVNGKPWYAIAAYNGGQKANCSSQSCSGETWWECSVNKGFAETRLYVQKVYATLTFINENHLEPQ